MKKQSGLSLVELMIALVLGLIIVATVIELFISSRQLYRAQEVKGRLQEDGRYALYRISEIMERAGYQGCSSLPNQAGFVATTVTDGSQQSGSTVINTLNSANNYFWSLDNPVGGYEATGNGWSPALPGNINNAVAGSDVLTIRTVGRFYTHITRHDSETAPLYINTTDSLCSPSSNPNCQNIMMVSTCTDVAIFQITNDPSTSNGRLEHATGAGTPGNSTNNLGAVFQGGWLNTIATNSFYVRNNPNGVPSLYQQVQNQNPDAIIEGVEQMQLTFGVDTDNDLSANQYQTANTITNWSQVISVRISLVMVNIEESGTNTNLTLGNGAYTLEGATVTPNDGRLRRVFTKTILLRNRTS